ncbi:aldose 1-epimerase [Paenibacillus sp. N1-5-1-14]|uniref:aldose 1-epimerase n=1 Tax=Paenibacillus radicibacter TaxID=2972488 RepID=UPI0021590A31|nr:aldose 1-epimerase [Paenibacillus radicibacter]MCR8645313.1 aldose 1-epimerase [Paenibacillus radicibacter]
MITQQEWQGETLYILENEHLSISLCPSINNNLIRIWDKKLNREVLRVPENPDILKEKPAHFGTPVLMPPNRIGGGQFTFEGRPYQFAVNRANNMHNHGILQNLPWTVKSTSEDNGVISITSTFRSTDFPEVMEQYPHDVEMEITYELIGSKVNHKYKFTNHSELNAPFGYGLHTWFLLDNKPGDWNLTIPMIGLWELENALPTGEIVPLGKYESLLNGSTLEGFDIDGVFQIGDNPCIAVLENNTCKLTYSSESPLMKHWVLYTQGVADNFVCLEPYTWVTNAPNLNLPPEVTGLQSIKPNQTLELDVLLNIEHK